MYNHRDRLWKYARAYFYSFFPTTKFEETICRNVGKFIYVGEVTESAAQSSDVAASSLRCGGVFERGMDLVPVNRKQK